MAAKAGQANCSGRQGGRRNATVASINVLLRRAWCNVRDVINMTCRWPGYSYE